MAGNRLRAVDFWHSRFMSSETPTSLAADEIIDAPEKHLLTQKDLFWAEGGILGTATQIGLIVGGFALLQNRQPHLFNLLRTAKLGPNEWLILGGTGYVSYKLGYWSGMRVFGDAQKVRNHWVAYYFVKEQNRFDGRQILSKKPKTY